MDLVAWLATSRQEQLELFSVDTLGSSVSSKAISVSKATKDRVADFFSGRDQLPFSLSDGLHINPNSIKTDSFVYNGNAWIGSNPCNEVYLGEARPIGNRISPGVYIRETDLTDRVPHEDTNPWFAPAGPVRGVIDEPGIVRRTEEAINREYVNRIVNDYIDTIRTRPVRDLYDFQVVADEERNTLNVNYTPATPVRNIEFTVRRDRLPIEGLTFTMQAPRFEEN